MFHLRSVRRASQITSRAVFFHPRIVRPLQPCLRAAYSTTASGPHPASTTPSPSSVNATEVSHFNALASSWWDPHGPSRLLHLMNPLRHRFISQCLQTQVYPPDASTRHRYLDIGCGGGIFAESAARLPNTESVTAIDPSPEVLAVAKQHQKRDPLLLEHGRLTYLDASIESLPHSSVPEGGFDIVSLFEVIEHIQHPSSFLSNVIPHVRPGGWLVLSTIARSPVSWFTTKLMAERVLNIVPRGTHTWSQYINPAELEAWFTRDDGFWKPQTMGVVYVPMLGWKEVSGSEKIGNYFFGVQRKG